jgi:hypothetical protein
MRSLPFAGNAVQSRLTVVDLLLQYPDQRLSRTTLRMLAA